MKEGWWISRTSHRYVALLCESVDHEAAVRQAGNQEWFDISPSVVKQFKRFQPRVDRDALLRLVMRETPLMRIRGHLTHTTVEFGCGDWGDIWNALSRWGRRFACPDTLLNIVNIRTGESRQMRVAEVAELAKGT